MWRTMPHRSPGAYRSRRWRSPASPRTTTTTRRYPNSSARSTPPNLPWFFFIAERPRHNHLHPHLHLLDRVRVCATVCATVCASAPRRAHVRLDANFRKLYKHTDSYLRSVSAMIEASKLVADDFAEALEAYPGMRAAADQFRVAHHTEIGEGLQTFGQMVHQKVFKPIRKEVSALHPHDVIEEAPPSRPPRLPSPPRPPLPPHHHPLSPPPPHTPMALHPSLGRRP
jgi:hypothetical protein